MDLETSFIVGSGLFSSKELITKILGPTADYIGTELKEFVAKRNENLKAVFTKANKKLGDRIEKPGAVPPRLLKSLIDDGSFADDSILQEYWSGVLASGRTGISRDDRSIAITGLIKSLSIYQLRTHCLFYTAIVKSFTGSDLEIASVANKFRLYIKVSDFVKIFKIEKNESLDVILSHSIVGLVNKGLLANEYTYGDDQILKTKVTTKDQDKIDSQGMILTPTPLGAELFLWALGIENTHPNYITNRKTCDSILNEFKEIKSMPI